MITTKLTNEDITKIRKSPISTKQGISMQATLESALNRRMPQNPSQPGSQPPTTDGFGRAVV